MTLSIVDHATGTYAGNIAPLDIDRGTGQARVGYRVAIVHKLPIASEHPQQVASVRAEGAFMLSTHRSGIRQ
jgi:hypothetical protein